LADAGEDERRDLTIVRQILRDLPQHPPEEDEEGWVRGYYAMVRLILRGLGWRETGPGELGGYLPVLGGSWPVRAVERRAAIPRAIATAVLLLAAAVALLHTGLFAGGALLNLVFPLSEQVGMPFLDISRTLVLLARSAELGTAGLLGFGGIRAWRLLRGRLANTEDSG